MKFKTIQGIRGPLVQEVEFSSSSGRWQASDELSALLPLIFSKELSAFERRAIVKDFQRPNVDCVFTPNPDAYLGDLVPQCKPQDKSMKKSQDLLLDVSGSLAIAWGALGKCRFAICRIRPRLHL